MDAPRTTKDRARALRRTLSLPEILLWRSLKGGILRGLKFRKQHPIGPYILDFYCDAAHLAVEIDGQSHITADRLAHDARRDRWLAKRGVRTLRLPARLVLDDVRNATRTIEALLDGELPDAPPPGELSRSD